MILLRKKIGLNSMKALITYNQQPQSIRAKIEIKRKLLQSGFTVSENSFISDEDFIIVIGGDGAFLKMIHDFSYPSIPIVGVNTGHLGFFQEYQMTHIDLFLESFLNREFNIQTLHPISLTISYGNGKTSTLLAINEFVVKSSKSLTVHLDLSINDSFIETFSGDGLLISSPSGSTAYNYSNNGAIIDPSLKTLQVSPMAPLNTNAYRSFTSSIITSSTSKVLIRPERSYKDSLLIVRDGMEHKFSDVTGISITTSAKKIELLRKKDYRFWTKVKEKFL